MRYLWTCRNFVSLDSDRQDTVKMNYAHVEEVPVLVSNGLLKQQGRVSLMAPHGCKYNLLKSTWIVKNSAINNQSIYPNQKRL